MMCRQGYGCFEINEDSKVECLLCNIELKYRDIDTLKRHLGTVRHQSNVQVAALKKQIQLGQQKEAKLEK